MRGCDSAQAQHSQRCRGPAHAFPAGPTRKEDGIGMWDCSAVTLPPLPGDEPFPNQRVPGGNPGCCDPSPGGRSPTGIITSCRPLCSPPRLPKTWDNWEREQKVRTVLLSDVRVSKRRWHRAGGNKGPSGSMRLAGTGAG